MIKVANQLVAECGGASLIRCTTRSKPNRGRVYTQLPFVRTITVSETDVKIKRDAGSN